MAFQFIPVGKETQPVSLAGIETPEGLKLQGLSDELPIRALTLEDPTYGLLLMIGLRVREDIKDETLVITGQDENEIPAIKGSGENLRQVRLIFARENPNTKVLFSSKAGEPPQLAGEIRFTEAA